MSEYETIILDKNPESHIARITLNRPERLNAISHQMGLELAEAIEGVGADDDMRCWSSLALAGASAQGQTRVAWRIVGRRGRALESEVPRRSAVDSSLPNGRSWDCNGWKNLL